MSSSRIDAPRAPESRAAERRSPRPAGEQEAAPSGALSFASLMATQQAVGGLAEAQAGELGQAGGQAGAALAESAEQGLAATAHAPWMSLVGQTARLDVQGDIALSHGMATDFLSGRGHATQRAHLQGLQQGLPSAHAAVQASDSMPNQPQVLDVQEQDAMGFDDQSLPTPPAHLPQDGAKALAADASAGLTSERQTATAQSAQPAAGALLGQDADSQEPRGISLQGMTAVQPQVLEGLKDWLRSARDRGLSEPADTSRTGSAQRAGQEDATGMAAAVGAAMGAAGAGLQGGGQGGQAAQDFTADAQGAGAEPSEREQQVSEQVAFWVHQKTQNAALSIALDGKPIQVQVQLQGQEAHVRFAADDEQARQLLAEDQAQLRYLLQAQGLKLAGVSVDVGQERGEGSRPGQGGEPGAQPQLRTTRVVAQVGADVGSVDGGGAATSGAAAGITSRHGPAGVDLFV